jgi:4-amino-4-deoxy-L-arabinose transferase-like glycosyltransferase
MVALILIFWWAFAHWMDRTSDSSAKWGGEQWMNAILAGLVGGLAIFIKLSAVFFVIGAALGLALWRYSLRDLLRNGQVWLIAILGALPGTLYLIYGLFIEGGLGNQFSGRFIPSLLVSPLNYVQWMTKVDKTTGGIFVMLALLGFFLTRDNRLRSFMFGLWGGYLVYSFFFNYLVASHDYYHLPFIPIVAVSLSPLAGWFSSQLTESTVQGRQRTAAYAILMLGLVMVVWNVRNQMKAVDYRPDAVMWAEIGTKADSLRIVAVTQDYGSRLQYWGWQIANTWPSLGEMSHSELRGGTIDSFDEMFKSFTAKRDLFLVTDFDEFKAQTQLRERLSSYPVFAQGDGYIMYRLR